MNPKLPIGIEIQTDGVRALQLSADRQGVMVRAAAQVPFHEPIGEAIEDLSAIQPAIKALVGQRRFKGRCAVVSLPSDCLYAFPITMEVGPEENFETNVALACRKHLSFSLDDAILDYFCIESMPKTSGGMVRVSVVAARKDRVKEIIRRFKRAGLRIDIIDYGLCGLMRTHAHIQTLSEKPVVLMQMDLHYTLLAVVQKNHIVAHRQLDWGMDRILRRITEALHLASRHQQPRAMLRNFGVDYDALQSQSQAFTVEPAPQHADQVTTLRVISQVLAPDMEALVQELFQIIGYARSVHPEIQFDLLGLYGMANEIKNLGPFLEKRVNIATRLVDPFKHITREDEKGVTFGDPGLYIGALGLALREAV